ncbi:MAG: YhdP family protein, partial [Mizugakiibacter sp.]|uniref:YhdP family protein n=1 Tax=Mizugakiibacter sp. TaxID=1972610 RepID=UPI00320E5DC6
ALDIGALAPLAALLPGAPPALSGWLAAAAPHGRIAQARLRWAGAQAFELDAQLGGVGFAPSGALPGIDRLDGTLRGDAAALSLELPAQATVFRYPHVFRKPFALGRVAGTVAVWSDADGTHIGTDALAFEGEGYGGEARGEMLLQGDGTRPFLDLYAVATHGDVPAAKLFWPVNVMPPSAVAWLDRALVAGRLTSAHVLVRGDLDDWPFPEHRGRFQALGEIEGATLDYGEGWPRAEGIAASADFVNAGMVVQARAAQVLGNQASTASAVIPDLADAVLTLAVEGSGRAPNLLDFVRRSPIGARYGNALKGLRLGGGSGRLGFTLVLPVAHAEQFTLDGRVQLADANLTAKDWNLRLDKINGPLAFDAGGFRASPLTARFHGAPANLALAVGADTADPAHQLEARMDGHFGVAQLVEGYAQLAKLPQIASGDSDFDIGLTIPTAPTLAAATPVLQVRSSLEGIAVALPAPLDKAADDVLPLDLRLDLPVAGNAFTVALGDVLRARARMPQDPNAWPAANVALGDALPAGAPVAGGYVGGRAGRFDLGGWAALAMAGQDMGPGGNPLRGADFTAADARLFGRSFHELGVKLAFEPAQTTLTLSGDAAAGTLSIPTQDLARRGVTARFERLHWPEENGGAATAAAASAQPAPAAASSAGAPEAASADTLAGVAPASVPPLHFWVGDLRLGKSNLGEARFESYPTAAGMRVEQMETHSSSVQLRASGDWNGDARGSRSQFTLDFYADDLGKMLDAFGYAGVFSGGETQAHIVAGWPGAPTAFDLARMDGTLQVAVKDGRIPEVSPGVGRLFGLFSVRELPRRLTLDFGDIFRSGFSFNTIEGLITFDDGSAWTRNLEIKGPAADIAISGRTGLKAKDYDQTLLVVPHVGGTLPVVGAIAGGPVGAAAGLAVQGLLGKGLNQAAAARYHVGGSWEKPQITLIAKGVEAETGQKPSENRNVP